MSHISQRNYWPYDEVTTSRDVNFASRFIISSPWLKFHIDVHPSHVERSESIAQKLSAGHLTARDLEDINWFFSSLAKYPLAYILPRHYHAGLDRHVIVNETKLTTPHDLLTSLTQKSELGFLSHHLSSAWTWDLDAALGFSQTATGYDPESLFSIAKRFHLLNDLENNRTSELLKTVAELKDDSSQFRKASAVIVRQNHYVTQMCEETLRAALPTSQNAHNQVLEFIEAERGHDKILAKALKSLGSEPAEIPVLESTKMLMKVFKIAAQRNFLAFAMIVDIFERTSYRKEDPLAEMLSTGGETVAARQADIHRDINDSGEHENIAIDFLVHMDQVDEMYAREALRLAELATLLARRISVETLMYLRN